MDKQTTFAFILIGGILVLWLYLNTPDPVPQQPPEKDTVTVQRDTIQQKTETPKTEPESVPETIDKRMFRQTGSEDIIVIENDLVQLEISTRGANIHKYFLKNFNNWYSVDAEDDEPVYQSKVQLINYSRGNALNINFVSTDGKIYNTADFIFDYDKETTHHVVAGDDSISIEFTLFADNDKKLIKRLTFFGNRYSFDADIEFIGLNNQISNNTYDLIWNDGIRFVEENAVDEANYANASVYYGDEQVIVDASDPGKKIEEDFNGRIDWMGVRNKYFAAIIIPKNPSEIEGAHIEGVRIAYNGGFREYYDARLKVPFKNQQIEKRSFQVYVGPVDYDILKGYDSRLEAIVDFGSFFGLKFIVRPIAEFILLPLFNFLHLFIPNYGFVIIVFSLIIKFVLYPLTKQSYQSMKKMQLLQPKIAELKEQYKEDPQKMNKETMKLYSTYGVNPAGGCLPLLLQMPIFIALWGLFQVAIELRQQPFMFWIHDLSRPDVIFQLPFRLPLFGIDQISGLALLMGITTFIQQKMSIKDPKQQALIYIMPVMLTLMFMSFPSGLNLYYFMFNVFTIAQQYYINHKHDGMVLEPVKNPKKSKGFMQKMMEAAEQSAKAQQKKKR
jgi:YidC/Oxa1 family membrane protein insertase